MKIVDFLKKFENFEGFNDVFRENMMRMIRWKLVEEVKVMEVKKWTCPQCKLEFEENIEKFRKFEREFCSIKCLRNFFNK